MKIYLVSTGSYSDYSIHSLFLDKNRALECKNFLRDANDIEEYETSDDKKFRYAREFVVHAKGGDFGLECSVNNYGVDPLENYDLKNKTYVFRDYDKSLKLRMSRYVFDEDVSAEKIAFYEDKYGKAAQDIWYIVKQKLSEGYTLEQINEMINS